MATIVRHESSASVTVLHRIYKALAIATQTLVGGASYRAKLDESNFRDGTVRVGRLWTVTTRWGCRAPLFYRPRLGVECCGHGVRSNC